MGGPWLGLQLMRQGYHLDMGCPSPQAAFAEFLGNLSNRSSFGTGPELQEQNNFYYPPEDKNMAFTDPKWFDSSYYMAQKLAQLQKAEPEKGWTADMVATAFAANGFIDQKDGSTAAYAHFTAFGAAEDVAPNQYFNANEYYYAKAADYFGVTAATATQAAAVAKMIQDTGMNAWTHYQQFGSAEGVNPSNAFDANAYLTAKATAMGGDWTAAKVAEAIAANNMTVLEHYMQFAGAGDGEVPAGATYPVSGGVVVTEPIYLTVAQDILSGTSGNDTFNATIFDNQNTLQSGDRIDGAAGHDVLNADLGTSAQFAATPEIKNVEVIKFRAQANAIDNGSNNVANDAAARIDAERIAAGDDGKLQLWSQDSRADLVIEDVRVNSNNVTIGMGNTDSGDVDMSVYFNNQYLKAENATTTGTLNLQLIDTVGALTEAQGGHANPLYDNPYTGFKFTLDGKEYTVDFKSYNHTTDETPSYGELAAQIQAAINADAALSKLGLTVTLGSEFDAVVGIGSNAGTHVTGTQIVVTSSQGALTGGTWLASNGLPETNSTSATMSTAQEDSCPLIKTNVALDNVAQVQWDDASACLPDDSIFGSQAGDLVIGAMGTRGGVERFDVTVERGSWLSSMSSTNNTLRMVTVVNGDTGNDGVDAGAGKGQLFIGDTLAGGNPMTAWQDAPRLLSTDGLTDVKTFDASAMGGNVNIGAQITSASYDKYLKDVDGVNSMDASYAPNGPFSYKTGSGNDTVNMTVNGGVAADRDFIMNVETGAGDDLINFTLGQYVGGILVAPTANEIADQVALKNVTIDTGAGNDVIKLPGSGAVKVLAGAGNDAIYTDNTGGQTLTNAAVTKGVYVLNADAAGAALNIGVNAVNGAQPLYNDVLSTSNGNVTVGAGLVQLDVTVEFLGVAKTVTVATWSGDGSSATTTVSQEAIRQAIITAINKDDRLSTLMVAKDGAGYSLLLESLVDGELSLADLNISFASTAKGATTTNPWALDAYTNAQFAMDGATVAGVHEVQTMETGAVTLAENDVFTFAWNGKTYTADALGATPDAAALQAALLGAKEGGNTLSTVADLTVQLDSAGTGFTITITSKTYGDIADAAIDRTTGGNINGETVTETTKGVTPDGAQVIGNASTATNSTVTVDAGAGDDMIILGTGAGVDTVVFNGSFGSDTIVNFHGNDAATVQHKMDFTSYLDKFDAAKPATTIDFVADASVASGASNDIMLLAAGQNVLAGGTGGRVDTAEELLAVLNNEANGFAANSKNVILSHIDGTDDIYNVFVINNDATAEVTAAEITVVGTVEVGQIPGLVAGDFVLA